MIQFYYMDANCLIKLVINESDSTTLRKYLEKHGVLITTQFCFYEALSVLKGMPKRKEPVITEQQYLNAALDLFCSVDDGTIQIEELSFHEQKYFDESSKLAEKYHIDLSDAFQLVTLKIGMMAKLNAGESILITEDTELRKAAKGELLQAKGICDLVQSDNTP